MYRGVYRSCTNETGSPATSESVHVLPVLVLRVVDDGPALDHRRLLVLAEHQAIGGLPDRCLDVVSQPDAAAGPSPRAKIENVRVSFFLAESWVLR